MKKIVSILLVIVILLSFHGCSSTGSPVEAWSKAAEAIRTTHAAYTAALKAKDYTSKYKSNEEILTSKDHQETYISKIKSLANKGITLDEAFLAEYLNSHTLDELYSDYQEIDYNSGINYKELPDKVVNWLEQITADFWKSLQEYYDVEPTTLYKLYSTNSGTYYSDHPDAKPQAETSTVKEVTYIDDDGKNHYETKENTTTVQYYGDYAVANEKTWSFGGGTYGWRNGTFIDIPDDWTCKEITEVYYMGKMVYQNWSSASEIRTEPILFVDGLLLKVKDSYNDGHTVYKLN